MRLKGFAQLHVLSICILDNKDDLQILSRKILLKLFRIFAASIMVVLLLGGILISIIQFLDWGDYRDNVEEGIGAFISQNISIDGEISLKIFPKPNFKLTEVTIYSGEGFDKPLLNAGSIAASFDLSNLLSQTSWLDELTVDYFRVRSFPKVVSPLKEILRINLTGCS